MPTLTDDALLEQVQRAMIEPLDGGLTWPSGLWTTAEVVGYANQRQDRWLKETLLVLEILDIPIVAQRSQQVLPTPWLATRHVYLTDDDEANETVALSPVSRREADLLQADWQYTEGRPQFYIQEEWATRTLNIVPLPQTGGVLHVIAAVVGTALTGLGVVLTIPDECAPYLYYGILADMFGKQGQAFDEPRRAYCEARYTEGVDLARALLDSVVIS